MEYEIMMNGNVKIGQFAPNFEANSTMGKISLSTYKNKWLVFFSHPGDFTPVCTTEMIAFTKASEDFEKRNAKLLGLSVDSNASHLAWVYDIYIKTGIKVSFPIIADLNGEVARKYGMISNDISNTETVRNVYIIDPKGVIRAILVYPMQIGRCIPEILRMVDALQFADTHSGATPANWFPGGPLIAPSPKTYIELEERVNRIEEKHNGMTWYLNFKDKPENSPKDIKKLNVKIEVNTNKSEEEKTHQKEIKNIKDIKQVNELKDFKEMKEIKEIRPFKDINAKYKLA